MTQKALDKWCITVTAGIRLSAVESPADHGFVWLLSSSQTTPDSLLRSTACPIKRGPAPYPQSCGELGFSVVHAVDRDTIQALEEEDAEGSEPHAACPGLHSCTQASLTSDSTELAISELYPDKQGER